MSDLAADARADAAAARQAAADYERTRPPSEIERQTASRTGRLLGVEVDPKSVCDLGYQAPYYVAEVTVCGITFRYRYMHDTNGLRPIAVGPTASRMVARPWWRGGRKEEVRVDICRIGDLDGWLDAPDA